MKQVALLATSFMLVSCLANYSTLKIKATCSSETSVDFERTTRGYITEYNTLHNHRFENLKSYIAKYLFSLLRTLTFFMTK
jgi:hypothetical protein